ncbi:MAG: hypothetical protein LBI78_07420 [Campylobacteraceae bacterium]|jgi:hypothetical protein|nr:hypothetical protein [Campylobacteraceae bacterium]
MNEKENINKENKMEENEIKLTITRDNNISIKDLSLALTSFDSLLKDYLTKNSGSADVQLNLKGVEKGSDIFFMEVVVAASLIPIGSYIDSVNGLFEFIRNLKDIFKKPVEEIKEDKFLTKTNVEKINNIIEVVENNQGASFQFNTNCQVININPTNIKQFKEAITLIGKIKEYDKEEKIFYENVLIQMQTVKDSKKVVKDAAYCYEIVPHQAIPTEISDVEAKREILNDPFNNYFLVDLYVNRMDGKVKLYRVVKLHNIVPKDSNE